MGVIVPIASGKGGVGKTVLAANLGVSLAARGKNTVLVDLDLGGSNLHTCLGIRNRNPSIGDWVYSTDRSASVTSLVMETDFKNLRFVPGDGLLAGTANIPYFKKRKLSQGLSQIDADFVIVDLGAGSAHNTVDFFLLSLCGFVVLTPETTSILNAYSFLKNAVFRMLATSYPRKSDARRTIEEFMAQKIETHPHPISELVERLSEVDTMSGLRAKEQLHAFGPRVIINDGRDRRDLDIGAKLREITRKNLGIEIEYVGFVGHYERIRESVLRRRPAYVLLEDSTFKREIDTIARRIIASPAPKNPVLYEDDEDLEVIAHSLNGRPVGSPTLKR